jgi:hypothetical protein
MIDIAPIQVFAAVEVIEFVAEKAVTAVGKQMESEAAQCEPAGDCERMTSEAQNRGFRPIPLACELLGVLTPACDSGTYPP